MYIFRKWCKAWILVLLVGLSGTVSAQVSVPNVEGQLLQDAVTAIQAAGLVYATTYQCGDSLPPIDTVISQNPVANTQVEAGSTVNLVVSAGLCISVPGVVGQTEAAAQTILEAANLYVGTVTEQCDNEVEAGRVISQDPAADTPVTAGTEVNLVVSTGPCTVTVTVPNVVNLPQADAEALITAANLYVGTVTEQCDNEVPAGSVISQTPLAGVSVPPDTPVNLAVSTGPCSSNVTVPNVVFQPLADAKAAITAAGLTVGTVTSLCDNDVPAGSVISQSLAAGTSVAGGTPVDLVVSTGPCPVTVPDVVNQPQADAEAAITAAGLTVGTITERCSSIYDAGSVISQDPGAGASVEPGTEVNLVVSTGPCSLVMVPDVVSLVQSAAEAAITAAGLTVGSVLEVCNDSVPQGNVISQYPAASDEVPQGSSVLLVVSSGPCTVTVPDMVSQAQSEAETAITAAGLRAQVIEVCNDTVAAGIVISQYPAANQTVPTGSPVLLVVSTGSCPTGGAALVAVPNVTGKAQATALAGLNDAGLNPGVVLTECSDTVAAGNVITQAPAAGAQVAVGTAVALVVSSGSCTPTGPVSVPNLVGRSESVAQSLLAEAGLTSGRQLYVFSSSKSPNTVLQQNPAARQSVDRGAAVDMVISRGLNLDPPSNRDIMKQLYDRLSKLDLNGDGLSLEEAVALEGLPGLSIEAFEQVDLNGDGVITEQEFVDYLKIGGCFGCVKRLFVKDLLVSAGGDLLLAGLGLALLGAAAVRRRG